MKDKVDFFSPPLPPSSFFLTHTFFVRPPSFLPSCSSSSSVVAMTVRVTHFSLGGNSPAAPHGRDRGDEGRGKRRRRKRRGRKGSSTREGIRRRKENGVFFSLPSGGYCASRNNGEGERKCPINLGYVRKKKGKISRKIEGLGEKDVFFPGR